MNAEPDENRRPKAAPAVPFRPLTVRFAGDFYCMGFMMQHTPAAADLHLDRLPPDAIAGHILLEMDRVRARMIEQHPPEQRDAIVAELDALQAARRGAGGAA